MNLNNININPSPIVCANKSGGVNSVVSDHALGFLAEGCSINNGQGVNVVHALAQSEQIDVFHCHGLYPIGEEYFDKSYQSANDIVLNNALKAKVTICISEFSANILRHNLHINPVVTRNGIWIKDYKRAGSSTGAVLFPKATIDAVSKTEDLIWLKDNSKFDLLSIAKVPGIKSTGKLDRNEFISALQSCSVYLGTTKENNSMATMEAMITGVPVVGYDTGFNAEWLTNGNGCILAPTGDRLALREAIQKVLGDWKRYSDEARAYAEIFDWKPVIKELLTIYERAGEVKESKTVSIIIPCHNYARFLGEAIQSAKDQTIPCEIIVIDDKSTDNSVEIAKRFEGVKVIQNETNIGVAETRNKAIRAATGEFIVCLDADDRLHQDFVEKHLNVFKSKADAIAYAPVILIDEAGQTSKLRMFKDEARISLQSSGRNQIPSCCMFRKEYWIRAGGYDKRFTPAEDANLWLKIFQIGGVPKRASSKSLMDYRVHDNQISRAGFPDWWLVGYDYKTITERDPEIKIVLDDYNEETKDTLWCLENQSFQKWSCLLRSPNGLSQTFPWLNRATSNQKSVLHLKSGTILDSNFLVRYTRQIPEWIQE